jgi:hypothetical protein
MRSLSRPPLCLHTRRNSRGWTWVGTLVVIAAVVGLAAVALWLFGDSGITHCGKTPQVGDDIKQIVIAVAEYRVKFGKFPENLDALSAIKAHLPKTDPWGNPFEYRTDGTQFWVRSGGELSPDKTDDIYWDPTAQRIVAAGLS